MAASIDATKEPGSSEGFHPVQYLSEVRTELQKAEWPDRPKLIRLTQVVLTLITIVALYCGALDGTLTFFTNKIFAH